jgi:hypothetical protein
LLTFERLGWKDIHATNQVLPNPAHVPRLRHYVKRAIAGKVFDTLKRFVPKPVLNKAIDFFKD